MQATATLRKLFTKHLTQVTASPSTAWVFPEHTEIFGFRALSGGGTADSHTSCDLANRGWIWLRQCSTSWSALHYNFCDLSDYRIFRDFQVLEIGAMPVHQKRHMFDGLWYPELHLIASQRSCHCSCKGFDCCFFGQIGWSWSCRLPGFMFILLSTTISNGKQLVRILV